MTKDALAVGVFCVLVFVSIFRKGTDVVPSLRKLADSLRATIEQKDSIIVDKDAALKQKEGIILIKEAVLLCKDEIIKEKDAGLREKDELIKEKDEIIKEKDVDLRKKDAMLDFFHKLFIHVANNPEFNTSLSKIKDSVSLNNSEENAAIFESLFKDNKGLQNLEAASN